MADAKLHGAIAGGFGGESLPGWWLVVLPAFAQRRPRKRGDGAFVPISPPCPTGKAGGKRPVPLPPGTAPPGTCAVSFSSEKYIVTYGFHLPQKGSSRVMGEPGKMSSGEDRSSLVLRFAAANQKSPCSTQDISASPAEPSHGISFYPLPARGFLCSGPVLLSLPSGNQTQFEGQDVHGAARPALSTPGAPILLLSALRMLCPSHASPGACEDNTGHHSLSGSPAAHASPADPPAGEPGLDQPTRGTKLPTARMKQ